MIAVPGVAPHPATSAGSWPKSGSKAGGAGLLGVVHSTPGGFFTRLERVTPDARTIGRRIWLALAALSAVAVVALSWSVPEPETTGDPRRRVENVSYMQYTPQQAPPPNYGSR